MVYAGVYPTMAHQFPSQRITSKAWGCWCGARHKCCHDWLLDIALRYWREAGVADKIDLRIGPAADTLDAMLAAGKVETYDFAFIDADKPGYDGYYERCLALLRPGGVIAIDNALWGGSVANSAKNSEDTQAIRALNEKISRDPRVEAYLAPVGDGVHLAWKR